ncbi:oxygen-regulated invasion protein OrgB [Chromobacterium sphagni]|uniref:oxygen-regulated invasion protein OrgB n=1 Tax=Chromobacterium sphagni TaxID=1903179 RepID=UPI0011138D66|nr:oxygen-regulated invasion protein OrgB [Chromobacterium sphagni]
MPRDIPTPRPLAIDEGVLIRRKQIHGANRHHQLERQARKQAQALLRDARREADAIQRQACRDGYQQGMQEALGQVAAHLADSQAQARRWRERLGEQAREMLSAAVDHPDTLLLLLDEWLRSQDSVQTDTLNLQLPQHARHLQPRLMALLADNWPGTIRIDYHADPRFVMRCADQAAEFSPEQYVEPAGRQLLQSLEDVRQDCRRTAAASLARLLRQLEHPLEPGDAAAPHPIRHSQGDIE